MIWHVITYAFAWQTWIGNISAEIIQLGVVFGIWKAAKKYLAPRLHGVVRRILTPHLEAHFRAIEQLIRHEEIAPQSASTHQN